MDQKTIQLSKPIQAHGKEVSELQLREPTVEDVMEVGYPFLIMMSDGKDTGVDLRPKVIVQYVSRLAGIPMSSAKSISLSDLSKVQTEIMSFFGQEIAAPSSN
jgi:hypothetical protein